MPALFASSGWFLAFPGAIPIEPLPVAARTEWRLAPGEVRRHVVPLRDGDFVQVRVVQAGIDVTVQVFGAGGPSGSVRDLSSSLGGWEAASLLAATTGPQAVEVAAKPDARRPGTYFLETSPIRDPDLHDRKRLAAEALRHHIGVMTDTQGTRRSLSDYLAALLQMPVVLRLYHDIGDTCFEAEALTHLARLRGWRLDHADVLELYPRVLDLWAACGDTYKQAEARIYAGEGYRRALHYARAAELYEEALALTLETEAEDVRLLALVNGASNYAILGDTAKLMAHVEQALPLLRAAGMRRGEAVALRNLALGHLRRGELQQAADRAQESLAIRREIADGPGEAATLVTLGEVYLALGEPASARRYLDAALALDDRGLGPYSGRGRILTPLAAAYEQGGDPAAALEVHEDSLARQQQAGEREGEHLSLIALGRFHLRHGGWEEASEAGSVAAELMRRAGDRHLLAEALALQGAAWVELGDAARAQAPLQESLDLRRLVQDGLGEAATLHELARVERLRDDPDAALRRLDEALSLIDRARTRIASPELRSTWLATVRGLHETHVDTLMELHRRDPRAGWAARAFEASESARARTLLDLLAESRADIRRGADPDLVARERSLRERLGALLERQLRLLSSAAASPERATLAREIDAASTEYEELRGRIRVVSPQYAAFIEPRSLTLEQVRSQVLDDDSLLLEYSLGARRSFLWVAGRDVFETFELPGQAEIEAAVRRARATTDRRPHGGASDSDAIAALSRMLLGPARAYLANRRLVFAADGPLHHVPFGALSDERGRRLVKTHEIVSAPSASALALLRSASATRAEPSRTLAVLADPVFDPRDQRVEARAPVTHRVDPTVERATRALGFDDGRLPRLVFTRREARSILALAPPGSRRVVLDFQASRAAVQDPELKEYRYLHFATHGLLNDVRPELSGLVLSLVDRDGRDVPGLLTAPDVFNLELGADLVVLSGCRTALGKEIRGEGLIGLTRAFMYAGVPRVVASLWPVDDLTTAELMKGFYEGMLGPEKLRPAAALRRAQARMARDPRWSAPYYWAGFQLQGDWR